MNIDEHLLEHKERHVEYMQKSWTQYTVGYDFGVEEASKNYFAFFKDQKTFDWIKNRMEVSTDSLEKRKLEILYRAYFTQNSGEKASKIMDKILEKQTELSKIMNNFRPSVGGKTISSLKLRDLIRNSDDESVRKEAFFAKLPLNKIYIENGYLDLLKLRNEFANESGFNNFYEMKLTENELDTSLFDSSYQALKDNKKNRIELQKYIEKTVNGGKEVESWNASYLLKEHRSGYLKEYECLDYEKYLEVFFSKLGIDFNKYDITFDLFNRKNKSEWGYQFTVDPGKDIRVLANLDRKYENFRTLAHEATHGIHSLEVGTEDYILSLGISGVVTEGLAVTIDSLCREEYFYKDVITNLTQKDHDSFAFTKKLDNYYRSNSLAQMFFDHSLYKSEISSHKQMLDLYAGIKEDAGVTDNSLPGPSWSSVIHFTTHPIYFHNYIYGDVLGNLLKEVYCKENELNNLCEDPSKFGPFLIEKVMKPSGRQNLLDLTESLTGKRDLSKYLFS